MTNDWRPIPGFDPRYEVSATGQLRSWAARGQRVPGRRATTPRIVKGTIGNHGYTQFGLISDKGKLVSVYMHQLVLAAFVGPLPEGLVSRHRNGNPQDNRLENLTYGTHQENHADREAHGRTARGRRSGKSKATEAIVDEILARRAKGESQMSIAKSVGLSQSNVSSILRGETWSHYTGIQLR